jgi:hypothetical protein
MDTWAEAQLKYTEDFGRKLESSWTTTQDFWKHLIVVEATILGLTVGLVGGRDPSITLVLSWVVLLLAVALGCVLVRLCIDVTFDGVLRGYRAAADTAGIMVRVESGELDKTSEEYRGLIVAATINSAPGKQAAGVFTSKARELARQYADKLPTSSFLKMPPRTPVERWLHDHWQAIEHTFYWLSVLAFVLLVVTAASWRSPGRSASTAPSLQPAPAAVVSIGPTLPQLVTAPRTPDKAEGSATTLRVQDSNANAKRSHR